VTATAITAAAPGRAAAALAAAQRRRVAVLGELLVVLAVVLVLSIGVGAVWIDPARVVRSLVGAGTAVDQKIIVGLRLPRVLAAVLIGAALAVSGVLLQAITRNSLASPSVVGVNGGAGLGALAVLSLAPGATANTAVPLAAFAGAAVAGGAAYLLSRRQGIVNPGRLALIGVAIGGLTMALIQLIIVLTLMQGDVQASLRWLTGSLWGRTWDNVLQLTPWVAVGLPAAWILASATDILGLGDDVPRSLGSRLEALKLGLLVIAIGLAGSAVAVGGSIAFIGLVAPHVCRRLVGPGHRTLIPAAALVGAALVLAADTLGRAIVPPTEIPVGLFTALIGAPYFLLQIRRGIA
jgi:iron complex transport system permease protein